MKNKEKEKLWLKTVKELCKKDGWKFKGYFIFKQVDNLFFCSNFYANGKENKIIGWLGYKTMNIDNVFWNIIDEQRNKEMPLSFRGEAAFCVRDINYFDYNIGIKDELNPEPEINSLLDTIKSKVISKCDSIKTLDDFRIEMLKEEKYNTVGIITSFIEQGQFEKAMLKIKEYKMNKLSSGFGFGDKDFYDLAKDYCEKNYR